MENPLCERIWICRKKEYRMNEVGFLVAKSIEPKRRAIGVAFFNFESSFLVCMQSNNSNSNHKPYF